MRIWSLGWKDPLRGAWQPIAVFSWATIHRITELDETTVTHYWSLNICGYCCSNSPAKFVDIAAAAKSLQSFLTVQPHRRQPTRLSRLWDSPGKNTGVGCHFLLQCRKVKSESEVTQSCPTLRNPMDCSLPGSSVHGILQARVLEWGAIAFSTFTTVHQIQVLKGLCLQQCSFPLTVSSCLKMANM